MTKKFINFLFKKKKKNFNFSSKEKVQQNKLAFYLLMTWPEGYLVTTEAWFSSTTLFWLHVGQAVDMYTVHRSKRHGGFNIQEIHTVVYQFFIIYSDFFFPYTICLEMRDISMCLYSRSPQVIFFLIINREKEIKVPSHKWLHTLHHIMHSFTRRKFWYWSFEHISRLL